MAVAPALISEPNEQLAILAGELALDPGRFVRAAWTWGEGWLEGVSEPDAWQMEYFDRLGVELRRRKFSGDPVEPVRMAVSSGHGIGKSAQCAMIGNFVMTTRPFSRGVWTAVGYKQLRTKTWPELAKWTRRSLWGDWFQVQFGQDLCMFHVGHKDAWRIDGQSPAKENSEAFAGLHAKDSSPWFLFDEASGIAEQITDVAQGGLTDGEPLWLMFGNLTRNHGFFHSAVVGRLKHRWIRWQIDSRSVRWTNKALIQQWIDDYGEDSDFVRVRVRGLAPRMSDMQFFSSEQVTEAMRREVITLPDDPIVFGVDCARYGADRSVVFERRGYDCRSWPPDILQGFDAMTLVGRIAERAHRVRTEIGRMPDAIFVDEGNIGAAVVDRLTQLGLDMTQGVNFGAASDYALSGDSAIKVKNKRAEIYARGRAMLPQVALWDSPDLTEEMSAIEYGYGMDGTTIQIASKDDIRRPEALGYSPDLTDAYCLLWSYPVTSKSMVDLERRVFSDHQPQNWFETWSYGDVE